MYPPLWGPDVWLFVHAGARALPFDHELTDAEVHLVRRFFELLPPFLMCKTCKTNAGAFPVPDTAFETGSAVWEFTLAYHNAASEHARNVPYTRDQAEAAFWADLRNRCGFASMEHLRFQWAHQWFHVLFLFVAGFARNPGQPTDDEVQRVREFLPLAVGMLPFRSGKPRVVEELVRFVESTAEADWRNRRALFSRLVGMRNRAAELGMSVLYADFNAMMNAYNARTGPNQAKAYLKVRDARRLWHQRTRMMKQDDDVPEPWTESENTESKDDETKEQEEEKEEEEVWKTWMDLLLNSTTENPLRRAVADAVSGSRAAKFVVSGTNNELSDVDLALMAVHASPTFAVVPGSAVHRVLERFAKKYGTPAETFWRRYKGRVTDAAAALQILCGMMSGDDEERVRADEVHRDFAARLGPEHTPTGLRADEARAADRRWWNLRERSAQQTNGSIVQ